MVLCVSDVANAEGEKGAMKFRWQRKPLGISIDCGGRGEGGGDEGLARTRGGYVADQGARAAKMKSAPGPGTTDLGYSTTPYPTKGGGAMAFKVYHFAVRMNTRGDMPTILRKGFENADEELKPQRAASSVMETSSLRDDSALFAFITRARKT